MIYYHEGYARKDGKEVAMTQGMKKNGTKAAYKAVAIGVSAGGMKALREVLPSLPDDFPLVILIVQHVHPDADDYQACTLREACMIKVKHAEDKEEASKGTAYLAPPDYHLLVEEDYTLSLSVDEPVNFARPSVDVLFESAADVYGPALIGVVMTGANNDGSKGLKRIRDKGGCTIVEDPATAEVPYMPKAALELIPVDYVVPLEEIGPLLVQLAQA